MSEHTVRPSDPETTRSGHVFNERNGFCYTHQDFDCWDSVPAAPAVVSAAVRAGWADQGVAGECNGCGAPSKFGICRLCELDGLG